MMMSTWSMRVSMRKLLSGRGSDTHELNIEMEILPS
jgi:hypothetical protein